MEIKQIFEKPVKQVALRLTETEKKIVQTYSEKENVSVNDFIRMSILYYSENLKMQNVENK